MPEPPLKDPTPLQPDYIPQKVNLREQERKALRDTVSTESVSQNLFIHGPRGTGKTHVTHLALQEIDNKCYVDCSRYDTQYKALKQILQQLIEDNIGDGYHTSDLQRKLVEKTGAIDTVVILDEIDFLLLNDGDDLLYFLTRIETHGSTGLVLISSNHEDLKEKIEERTYSSLQPRRIGFEPYTAEEAFQLLIDRAQNALTSQSLQKSGLTYITATTQNITAGLHWLKHAAATTDSIITESHVQQVQDEAFEKYAAHLLSQFSEHHHLLYQAVKELDTGKPPRHLRLRKTRETQSRRGVET